MDKGYQVIMLTLVDIDATQYINIFDITSELLFPNIVNSAIFLNV